MLRSVWLDASTLRIYNTVFKYWSLWQLSHPPLGQAGILPKVDVFDGGQIVELTWPFKESALAR
jgi:hypothetical protein